MVLFVIFHLLDLTWGPANPDFVAGEPYHNMVASFERVPVALVYIVANLALGVHLYHGAWSLFQSLGWVLPWRRAVRDRVRGGHRDRATCRSRSPS